MTIRDVHDAISYAINVAYIRRLKYMDKIIKAKAENNCEELQQYREDYQFYLGKYIALQDVLSILADCDDLTDQLEGELIEPDKYDYFDDKEDK